MKNYLCLILIHFLYISHSQEIFTMFYNVENLFDTIDSPINNDNEFLPQGKKQWNTDRYNQKINQLTKVFSSVNNGIQPNLIGLCEIENELVIKDLLKTKFFKNYNYQIIHKDSPDQRGIDCALLIDENFELLKKDFIQVQIPSSQRPTRDIVYAKIKIQNEILNIFVNHWPSRWGGQEETNYKRVFTAKKLKDYINKQIDKSENIIIMGDLNDYHSNESISQILIPGSKNPLKNLMNTNKLQHEGSYNYKGKWNFIDHIIVSENLLKRNNPVKIIDYDVFIEDWLLYTNNKGEKYPSRTYGGNNWYGGFSDHLPIFCVFKLQ